MDMQEDIDEIDWNDACFKAQTQTINTRFKLLQYKWLMRTYITLVKLHHISVNIPDVCSKCLDELGTLHHCLWECPKIQKDFTDVTIVYYLYLHPKSNSVPYTLNMRQIT